MLDADHVGIAFDETSTEADLAAIAALFGATAPAAAPSALAAAKARGKNFLTQPVFHENRSETEMMRFLRRLADKDLALDRAMIPLGSCTMKLNAAAEMMPVSWPSVANLHPFAPAAHSAGYRAMIDDLERWLAEITGFDAVSLQPNAGSQGEYAGLLAIRRFHASRGEGQPQRLPDPLLRARHQSGQRRMAGMRVVVVACTEAGDIDVDDLKAKAAEHAANLAALMITYPSTHGVFEEGVREICAIVHEHGGQVYLDGANLNALVGLARPGDIGADVCHMNLHKTFCIPHGGGGPGVGPIGVKAHLQPFLPGHVAEGSAHAVDGRAVRQRLDPADHLDVHPHDGRRRPEAGDGDGDPNANYIAERLGEAFPGAVSRAATAASRMSASSTRACSRTRPASASRTSPSG